MVGLSGGANQVCNVFNVVIVKPMSFLTASRHVRWRFTEMDL